MKKVLSLLLLAVLTLSATAQQINRNGNTYVVDGQLMNKKDFAAYMQQNAEASWSKQFSDALHLSKVGWGLFGGGLALDVVGVATAAVGAVQAANSTASDESITASVLTTSLIGGLICAAGEGCLISGIVCLGVGYSRMHNTADGYAMSRYQKPTAYWSIQKSSNGLGLALHF